MAPKAKRNINRESPEDKEARLKLHNFLEKASGFLERTHRSVTGRSSRLNDKAKQAITLLWKDAEKKLQGAIQSQAIGNPKWRRGALSDAGVFGSQLDAKESLFDWFSEEKRFLAVLRLLASIFGSLSKAFPVLSAVKELIDAILCARDWPPIDPEILSLGNLT